MMPEEAFISTNSRLKYITQQLIRFESISETLALPKPPREKIRDKGDQFYNGVGDID